ncbi:hypothetical protein FRB91_007525 [Serendipita sp. 411]|nr:hypothetical protein FRB91_007525 [Serendipita sp. 411]
MATPQSILQSLLEYYSNRITELDIDLLAPSKELLSSLSQLEGRDASHAEGIIDTLSKLRSSTYALLPSRSCTIPHRQLYTDTCIAQTLTHLLLQSENQDEMIWLECTRLLDGAIVFAGAPGNRMAFTQSLIELLQETKLPADAPVQRQDTLSVSKPAIPLPPCGSQVPKMQEPDMMSFLSQHCKRPFVIPAGIKHWPAVNSWTHCAYLKAIAGRGRVVPVEIGKDYRVDSWTQEMMKWEDFLERIENGSEPTVYLAQHSLLSQFPRLRDDIVIPDIVYYSPPCDDIAYSPPTNEDGVVLNAWLGPEGTVSPAHQDPYFNCYAQVVGRKTVWLAPPEFKAEMHPLPSHSALSNTSSLDVFNPDLDKYPMFQSKVLKESMAVTLQPGDLLYFPPRWWHAMRSQDKSFSISFWF